MKFKAEFDMDNAAFEDNAFEVYDILKRLADRVRFVGIKGKDKGLIRDMNGNKIGQWSIEE